MTWLVIIVVVLVALILMVSLLLLRWSPASLFSRFHQRPRQISIEDAWQSWWRHNKNGGSQHDVHLDPANAIDDSMRESVHKSLLELERRLNQEPRPMLAVRMELMDGIDRYQLNSEILKLPADKRAYLRQEHPDVLQTDEAARTYICANELRNSVLREYARLRYGDAADGDWFHVYLKASGLRQRGTRNFIERVVEGTQNANDDVRFQTMTLMDSEIRKRLLRVPPGTRFPGFGQAAKQGYELT